MPLRNVVIMTNLIIKYLVLSDLHLGHAKNHTVNIVANLNQYFKDNHKLFKELKIIFLAGDIFDKLLMTNSKQYLLVIEWLTVLSNYCAHNHIKLRILEGTESHDWQQAGVLNTVLNKIKLELDFKYIDTLTIEYMADLDMNILYIPDEYNDKAIDTYHEVQVLMKELNLTEVDIAIMHGQFHYQLPHVTLESSHDENSYSDIVKYFINIGHIHKHSVNGKILAQGSFDRLAHNEEAPKGGIVVSIDTVTENAEWIFIPNKRAMTFKTLDYSKLKDYDVYKELDKLIKILRHGSHIRIQVSNESLLVKNKHEIRAKYPMFNIEIESKKQKDKKDERIDLTDTVEINSFNITPKNISTLMEQEMVKYNLSKHETSILQTELKQIF